MPHTKYLALVLFALTAVAPSWAAAPVPPTVFAPAVPKGSSGPAPSTRNLPPPGMPMPPSAPVQPKAAAAAPQESGDVTESVPAKRLGKVNGSWVFRGDDNTYLFEPTKDMKVVRKPRVAAPPPVLSEQPESDVPPLVPNEKRPNLPSAVGTAGPAKPLPAPTAGAKPATPPTPPSK